MEASNSFIKKRKFTDTLCALAFIIFIIFIGYISIWGFAKGDLNNIAVPFDSSQNACGRGDRSDFPHLFVSLVDGDFTIDQSVCIKECPKTEDDDIECVPNDQITSCDKIGKYDSFGFLARICLPKASELLDKINLNISIDYFTEMIAEIKLAWPGYIISFFLALIICFLFYWLLQYISGILVWAMILGSVAGFILGGFLSYKEYKHLDDLNQSSNGDRYFTLAIILWVLAAISILFVICLCSQINLALKIINASSDFIGDRKSVLIVPLIFASLLGVFVIFWIFSFLMVYSTGEIEYISHFYFGKTTWDDQTKLYVGMMIMALCWFTSFTLSCNIFVLASITATWYFDPAKQGISILNAFCWSYTYHLGSLAFGSLLIALLWMIQIILGYIYQKVKDKGKQVKYCVKCAQCFVACFERILRFVNRHAYIEIVLRNKTFCGAVFKTVSLLTGNFLRFGVFLGLVELVLLMGTLFVTIITVVVCFYILQAIGQAQNEEYETLGPIILMGLIAFMVSLFFNYVFSVAADTLIHCYIYEEENPHLRTGNCPQSLMGELEHSKAN